MNVVIADNSFNCANLCNQLLMQWEGQPYGELAVLTSWLKALASIHQSHHWQASADPFYGDHLMFDRLYSETNEMVDRVAEKAVGVGSLDLADPMRLIRQTDIIMSAIYFVRPGIPQPTDLAARSLHIEKCLLDAIICLVQSLETRGLMTLGVDNMMAELADKHEGHVYLLRQRCSVSR